MDTDRGGPADLFSGLPGLPSHDPLKNYCFIRSAFFRKKADTQVQAELARLGFLALTLGLPPRSWKTIHPLAPVALTLTRIRFSGSLWVSHGMTMR